VPPIAARRVVPEELSSAVPHGSLDRRLEIDAVPGAEAAGQLRTFPHPVTGHASLARGALDQRAERGELGPIGAGEVRLDRLDRLDDVSLGVEDAIAFAGHDTLKASPEQGRSQGRSLDRHVPAL
jgi:hypothetical protein